MDNNFSDDARFIEAILFLENEPLSLNKLEKMTGLNIVKIKEALNEIYEVYFKENHGIILVQNDNCWSFVPDSRLNERLRKCYGRKIDKRLTKAAMETLAIVAYSQPITRKEIDNIRGVISDSIIRVLKERDYIKILGRKDVPGHPCLYGTTRKFLFEFGINSISALPKMSDIDKQRFEKDEN